MKNSKFTLILLILLFLLIHLLILNDYGFTWDFHYHFFGGGKLLGIEPNVLEPRNLPFVEPDPRRAWTLPYGPLMSIPPVASYLLLRGILPPDSAYHLPIILWGVAGIGILYAFLKEAFSPRVALFGSLFLALTPRYFGDLHNNMKDVPSAVIFALNMWLLWRLVHHKRLIDLLFAALAFAVAFNIKINSIFIPLVFAVWTRLSTKHWLYYLLAPSAAVLLWSIFWPNPFDSLQELIHFSFSTNNIEVLLNGRWYCSGSTVPWYYPYWYLVITTPLPILVFFVFGVFSIFTLKTPSINPQAPNKYQAPISKRLKFWNLFPFVWNLKFGAWNLHARTLLLLWFIVPLTRYLLPNIGVIDGVRHFEEVLFPIAAIAALGTDFVIGRIGRIGRIGIIIGTFAVLLVPIVSYHPYQITYFNELVGGVKGAYGRYDLDYWGTSQKAAVQWVNDNAPPNAKVHIIMAAAVAGQYLRADLIDNLNKFGYDESDFVILLNRTSFLYRFFYAYEYYLHRKPTKTIDVRGVPLVWIYDNRTDNRTPRQTPFWQDEDPCIIKYWRGEKP